MGDSIKSNEESAQAYQGEITNNAGGLVVDGLPMPSQTNLTVCSNASICFETRGSAVSTANSNLHAEARGIGGLAENFSAFDRTLGQQNTRIGE